MFKNTFKNRNVKTLKTTNETYLALPERAVKEFIFLTAKDFILKEELGGEGGGGGGGIALSGKLLHAIHLFEKTATEPPC